MGEPNIDLWEQFADDQPVNGSLEKQPLKKSAATDGSEWSGPFDRRSHPREEPREEPRQEPRNAAGGTVGQVSEDVGARASNQDQLCDEDQQANDIRQTEDAPQSHQ